MHRPQTRLTAAVAIVGIVATGALEAADGVERVQRRNLVENAGLDASDADSATKQQPLTLEEHMSLAGNNLISILAPQKDYLPYWMMRVDDQYRADLWFRPRCDAHNIGRWWDAMLRLEDAIGFRIPKEVEAGMLRNFWKYTDNPFGILLDVTDDPNDASRWYVHSFRETMLTYAALVRYRNSQQAAEAGRRSVRKMARVCADPRKANFSPTRQPLNTSHPVYFHGRAIEGLVLFHKATGDKATLEFAGRLAAYHLENMTKPDGSRGRDLSHHTHSYLNTLRGLLLYGQTTGQRQYVDRVDATYRNAVAKMITPSGVIPHDIDGGSTEVASAGDVAQLALWLHDQTKDADLLDDVERIVRSRLLPSQIIDPPPLKPTREDSADEVRDLSKRMVGAVGGVAGHTWGKSCVTDITASALQTLIDFYNYIAERDEEGIWIRLHFDCDREYVRVRSTRGEDARLSIEVLGEEDLFVRVPGWAPGNSVKLLVGGKPAPIRRQGTYVTVPGSSDGLQVELRYALPRGTTTETSRMQYYHTPARPVGPTTKPYEYTLHWRGDEVIAASPVQDYFPLYPAHP